MCECSLLKKTKELGILNYILSSCEDKSCHMYCKFCNTKTFFSAHFEPRWQNYQQINPYDYYECILCHQYGKYILNFEKKVSEIKKEIYLIDNTFILSADGFDYLLMWNVGKMVKCPRFPITKEKFYSKFKIYTLFQ